MSHNIRPAHWALTLALLAITPAFGAAQTVADRPPAELRWEDALRRVETTYPKLLGADAERRAASAKRLSKQGAFDLLVTAGSDTLRYNSSTTRGKALATTVSETGIELLTRSGLKLFAGARINTGSVKSPLSSTGSTGEYFAGVKLPLLRGQGLNEKSAGERQAILGEPLANQNFAVQRLNILLVAAVSYWDWVAAGRRRTIAQNLFELSRVRADAVRTRADRGDLPGIDAVEADSEVERRRGALAKADRDWQKTALKLALYLGIEEDTAAGEAPRALVDPAALPSTPTVPAPLPTESVAVGHEQALQRRPEVEGLRLSREILHIDRRLAENDRRPVLDLVFNPGADTGQRSIGETLKLGFQFAVPLERREATGRRDEAQLKLEKLEQESVLLQRQIRNEVDDAISAVNATIARYEAARRELELARRLETGERDRFALGEGTLFLVNQRERATAEAAARVIDLEAEYEQAMAQYRAVTAQL